MGHLPIVHMTLYKHGVGYFRRRGSVEGEAIKFIFRREEMVDATKEQIQKNMTALSKEGEEGRLRGRYVKQLTQKEEELAEIDRIVARTRTEIEHKQAQIEKWIAALGE